MEIQERFNQRNAPVMPTNGDSNLILCRSCWNRELAYRSDRNRSLGDFAKFALPPFETAKEYETT